MIAFKTWAATQRFITRDDDDVINKTIKMDLKWVDKIENRYKGCKDCSEIYSGTTAFDDIDIVDWDNLHKLCLASVRICLLYNFMLYVLVIFSATSS